MIIEPTLDVHGDLDDLIAALRTLQPGTRSSVIGYLSDGDYALDVNLCGREANVTMRATLRDVDEQGGTWWTTRKFAASLDPDGAVGVAVEHAVTTAVEGLRRDFARLLHESRPAMSA